jgi:hypothetical protein
MVSVQKIWQHNQSQTGISFGFEETMKQKARPIGKLYKRLKSIKLKTLSSNKSL